MNGKNEVTAMVNTWIDEWHNLPQTDKVLIRALIKALDKNRIQAQAMAAQEAKITEQAALLDRYDTAMKAQAFQLGSQDRELIRLRFRAKTAEAGDVATLRIDNAFQRSEIQRLKAALAEREKEAEATSIVIEAAITIPVDQWEAADVAGWLATVNENASAFMEWHAAHSGSREAASEAKIKALQSDVERLKGIADHSNMLAHNRLEELAKLRRELAVARDATAKLDDMVIRSRSEAEELATAFAQSEAIRSEQRQAIGQLTTALAEAREAARFQAGDLQCWRFVADHATRVRFQEMREAAQSEDSNFTWYKLQPAAE